MLIRQTILYLPAQIVGPLFLFGSVIVWTHLMEPKALGIFALVTAAQELIYAVVISWFSFWTMRYVGSFSDPDGARRFRDTEAPLMVATTIVCGLLGAVILPLFVSGEHSIGLMAASAAYVSTRALTTHFGDRARAQQDVLSYSVLATAGPVVGLAIGLLMAILIAPTPTAALTGLAIAQILGLLVAVPRLGLGALAGPLDRTILQASFAFGLPFLLTGPLIWLSTNGIRFIVELMLGTAAVGLLTVGWALGQRGAAVAAMLTTAAAYPLAVKRTREQGHAGGVEQLARNGILLVLILAPAMVGLIGLGPQIVDLIIAQPYREVTIELLPYAALAGLVQNVRLHYTNQVYLLIERPWLAAGVDLVEAIAAVVLCVMGILLGGLKGAVIGVLAAMVVAIVYSIVLGKRRASLVIPWLDFLAIGAANLIMLGALWLMPRDARLWVVLLEIGAGAAVYGLALFLVYPRARQALLHMMTLIGERRPSAGS